jgi:transcriptional regulator
VPTWNYEAVHVTGALTWFDDRARLLDAVERLSDHHERGRPEPWSVAEAPPDYIEALLRGIVGFELRPTRVEAKRKLSQHRPADERAAVAAGLMVEGATGVAGLMEVGR